MFTYKIYAKEAGAKRAALIAATDFRDVARFIKSNIAPALGNDSANKYEITISEAVNVDFFTRPVDDETPREGMGA